MNNATRLNQPIGNAQLIENHLAAMRRRDAVVQLQCIRLDIAVMQCELAVDKVFAARGYEAKS